MAIRLTEESAPSTPASGKVVMYAKADGLIYSKDDAGSESLMSNTAALTALTGDVTATGPGSAAATIASGAVTNAKQADMVASTIKGRISTTGAPQDLTTSQVKTLLDLAGSNTGDQTISLTGDVTGSGTGSFATTIANDAVTTAKILNDAVTNAKLADVATSTFKGRVTGGSGDPEDLSVSQAKTLLNLTGTNSGDQTITLTGDVTGSGTGSFAATIANDAVSFAKMQNISTARLLGRSTASSGDIEELTVGSGLSLSGGALSATGSPGGSDSHIQYNNGGSFGGEANLVFDDATTSKRLGIQVSAPLNPLHVTGAVGAGVDIVTGASCTRVAESLSAAPTVITTLYPRYPAPATGSGVQNTGGTGYTATGQSIDYRVYGKTTINGVDYANEPIEFNFTDTLVDASDFSVSLDWDPVFDALGYYIDRQVDGGGYFPYAESATDSYEDENSGAGHSAVYFPTVYVSNFSAPDPVATFDYATQFDDPSGVRTSDGTWSIQYQVESYRNVNGIKYVSGTPAVYAGPFTDSNSSNAFYVDLGWTSGGSEDGFIVRYSENGGSTWSYFYAINPEIENQQANDTAAEADWSRPFAGFTGADFTFRVYGKTTGPTGATIYHETYNEYTVTVPNNNNPQIIKHDFSSIPAAGYKIIGIHPDYSYGFDGSADYFDLGYTGWTDGATVTPNHYGYTGTSVNRNYRIYTYDSSAGVTFYSSTYVEVSMTTTAGYHYADLDWTLPAGADGVKILRSINGGAYNLSRTVASPTVTALDVSNSDAWSSGNVTVTPITVEQIPARFDRTTDTSDTSAMLQLVSIAASNPMTRLLFGTAASSAGAVTTRGTIGTDGSHRFYIDPGNAANSLWIGDFGNPDIKLETPEVVFNCRLADVDFKIQSTANSQTFGVDAGSDVATFGSAASSFNGGTIGDYKAAIKSNNADGSLLIQAGSSQTGDFIKFQNSSGTALGGFNSTGLLAVPSTGSVTTPNIACTTGSNNGFSIGTTVIGCVVAGTESARFTSGGWSIKTGATPGAYLHLGAGTTAGSTCPLKFTSGSLNTTPVAGAVEFLTDKLYFTITTGTARKEIALADAALTSGRVPFVTTNGRLTDDADFAFATDTLSVTKLEIKAGSSTGLEAKPGGVLYVTTTQTGNVGSGEDDLASYAVPAATLDTNLDSIWFEASGTYAATANNKRLRVRFGTSGTALIFDTGSLAITAASVWTIRGRVIRTGAATQKGYVYYNGTDAAMISSAGVVTGLDQTLSGAVTLKITGEATSNNDIVLETFNVGWEPNNT